MIQSIKYQALVLFLNLENDETLIIDGYALGVHTIAGEYVVLDYSKLTFESFSHAEDAINSIPEKSLKKFVGEYADS